MAPDSPKMIAQRYSRQMALPQIGTGGQDRLAASSVLIVGCGALGSMQAELAARAGIGRLVIADRDVVELHNLQRQLLFDERDAAQHSPKATAAVNRLREINSEIKLEPLVIDVTSATIGKLLETVDLILDGTDNFETRYLLNDACVKVGKPWVYGGVLGTYGSVMAIRPGAGPCLRCLLPEVPETAAVPTCETQGVLNTAVAWVAALQVTEAFKLLVADPGAGSDPFAATEFRACSERSADPKLAAGSEPGYGSSLYSFNVWSGEFHSVKIRRRDACACCGQRRFEFLEAERCSTSVVLCGRNAVQITPAKAVVMDLGALDERLRPLGPVSINGLVLEFSAGEQRLVVFPDGRVLVMGTTDPSLARNLVAKYIGC